jgi:phenylalanyl-tRNA synthetase alpha chain
MKEKIEQIRQQALAAIEDAAGIDKLNDVKVAFLGKKGQLSSLLKGMKDVAPEDRPKVGQMVNEARAAVRAFIIHSKSRAVSECIESVKRNTSIGFNLYGKTGSTKSFNQGSNFFCQ